MFGVFYSGCRLYGLGLIIRLGAARLQITRSLKVVLMRVRGLSLSLLEGNKRLQESGV